MVEKYVLHALPSSQQAEWETFLAGHPRAHFLQCWNWGELKAGTHWQPLRLVMRASSDHSIVAAAQVLRRTVPHLPARLGHLAYLPRGPILDWTATTSDGSLLAPVFLQKLRTYLRPQGAFALQIEPHITTDSPEAAIALATFKMLDFQPVPPIQPVRTIALDIQPEEEVIMAGMKEKWRYNVRLASRKGVEVRVASSLDEVRAWYDIMQTTGERDDFGIHTFEYYRKAWEILSPGSQARLFLAYAHDELLAGIFVTHLGYEAIYLYGASSNAQRNLMPNYLLQWEAIRWSRQVGARLYDFWGIPATDDADEAMAGVYRFKSGWGGHTLTFVGNFQYTYHPLALRLARLATGR